jgi:hypothetical protein
MSASGHSRRFQHLQHASGRHAISDMLASPRAPSGKPEHSFRDRTRSRSVGAGSNAPAAPVRYFGLDGDRADAGPLYWPPQGPRPKTGPTGRRTNSGQFRPLGLPVLIRNTLADDPSPAGSARQSSARKTKLDCFVASAPRNDGAGDPDHTLNHPTPRRRVTASPITRPTPPCTCCLPVPHLPSSPTAKTGQAGRQRKR